MHAAPVTPLPAYKLILPSCLAGAFSPQFQTFIGNTDLAVLRFGPLDLTAATAAGAVSRS
jgi:hypothetical protein